MVELSESMQESRLDSFLLARWSLWLRAVGCPGRRSGGGRLPHSSLARGRVAGTPASVATEVGGLDPLCVLGILDLDRFL